MTILKYEELVIEADQSNGRSILPKSLMAATDWPATEFRFSGNYEVRGQVLESGEVMAVLHTIGCEYDSEGRLAHVVSFMGISPDEFDKAANFATANNKGIIEATRRGLIETGVRGAPVKTLAKS